MSFYQWLYIELAYDTYFFLLYIIDFVKKTELCNLQGVEMKEEYFSNPKMFQVNKSNNIYSFSNCPSIA